MRRRVSAGWEVEQIQRQLEELLGLLASAGETSSGWSPPLDLLEYPNSYTVRVDLPGVKPADLVITLRDQELHIAGRKQHSVEENQRRHCHQVERGFGPFAVEVLLPGPVRAGSARARLRDGVLEVSLPRVADRRSSVYTIPVQDEEP
jgi:HSP20 family protein